MIHDTSSGHLKISIVVPTYNTSAALEELVESLGRQTLPTDEYEVVLVDDGSSDDTFIVAERLAARWPHVRAHRIEHSGGPCRPRNVGVDLARGEYVLFMDQDDQLYPDGLRAAYELGHANGADVVNGKESKTRDLDWGMTVFTHDFDNAIGLIDPNPLMPMTPHKLYRREFLVEHGIRFRDDKRVLWEDIYFNADAYASASVISVLASTPLYYWIRHPAGTLSSSFHADVKETFAAVRSVMEHLTTALADPRHDATRHALLIHQVRVRILNHFGPGLLNRPSEEASWICEVSQELLRDFVPPELDRLLDPRNRVTTSLLRHGHVDLLRQLVALPPLPPGIGRATSVRWDGPVLDISAEVRWTPDDAVQPALRHTSDGVFVDVPEEIAAAAPDAVVDLTEQLGRAKIRFGALNRSNKLVWDIESTATTRVGDLAVGGSPVVVSVSARWDATHPRQQDDLEALWDFNVRAELLGRGNRRALQSDLASAVALVNGRSIIAFANDRGNLTIDIGQWYRQILVESPPDWQTLTVTTGRKRAVEFTVALPDVAVHGDTTLAGTILFDPAGKKKPAGQAAIVADSTGAWLKGRFTAPRRSSTMTITFGRLTHDAALVEVGKRGSVSITPLPTVR